MVAVIQTTDKAAGKGGKLRNRGRIRTAREFKWRGCLKKGTGETQRRPGMKRKRGGSNARNWTVHRKADLNQGGETPRTLIKPGEQCDIKASYLAEKRKDKNDFFCSLKGETKNVPRQRKKGVITIFVQLGGGGKKGSVCPKLRRQTEGKRGVLKHTRDNLLKKADTK